MPELLKLPLPSSSSDGGPTFHEELGRRCTIRISFAETQYSIALAFDGVEAFKCTYYTAIDVALAKAAYDKVVDLGETDWLFAVKSNIQTSKIRAKDTSTLRHVAVMFDDGPAYEFICRDVQMLEDGKAVLGRP